ncbi:MAG: glycoside hydrolase family 3 C-terminal domain-containing protein [Lachnospiraceae bacterium]|nr:glycoside hydrolase family 3 C-terminal domain-containing protein [Lachnospiraceae bacterium]
MEKEQLKEILAKLTLEEKASLCSGSEFWFTQDVPSVGIPKIMVSDGPNGLRKQDTSGDHLGVNDSIKAVCFPSGCGWASSFDRSLATKIGENIGEACQAENVAVILGPALNIKRSPLCGRNFEYLSEDPYLAGELAAAYVKGVQSKNVGTSVKHFAANSQETRRMSADSVIDERTLHEIYLSAFEKVVKDAKPWTVMCSYNRLNGTYAAENKELLTGILRDRWGFEGVVVSDWGAVNDRPKGVEAGLDLEMPSSNGVNDARIVEAVKNGELSEEDLDKSVLRMLDLIYKHLENRDETAVFDREAQHEASREIAEETMVLLKNEDRLLPLSLKHNKIAFIGKYAEKPRYQGGGSAHINTDHVVGALGAAEAALGEDFEKTIVYAKGYDDTDDVIDPVLEEEAVKAAKHAKVAVIFAGLPDDFESEGYDREHMRLPDCQNHLIEEVCKVQKHVVVVLHNGSPVEMPWIDEVGAVLESYLAGEAVGEAQYNILTGAVNPSAKLAETFPKRLEDTSSYLYYFGEGDRVEYREGVFVGYRYYDKKKTDVLFPFGHGLSYTEFAYANFRTDSDRYTDEDDVRIYVDVQNTGEVAGKEIVQVYVRPIDSAKIRPVKELKGFAKVELAAGEAKNVSIALDRRAFAYYDEKLHDFFVEEGEYEIMVGASSRDIKARTIIEMRPAKRYPTEYTMNTILGDFMKDAAAMEKLQPLLDHSTYGQVSSTDASKGEGLGPAAAKMEEACMMNMPIRGFLSFSDGTFAYEDVEKIIADINAAQE